MLEYSELFEEGYTKSRDPNFKCFTRRAQARLEMKSFAESLMDIDAALELFPEDKGAMELKDLINKRRETSEDIKK